MTESNIHSTFMAKYRRQKLNLRVILLVSSTVLTANLGIAMAFLNLKPSASNAGFTGCAATLDTGCAKCVATTCSLGQNQFLIGPVNESSIQRCVEYDGVPPAHCANVTDEYYLIGQWTYPGYDIVGSCDYYDCAHGVPTSTECDDPWYPPPAPQLRIEPSMTSEQDKS